MRIHIGFITILVLTVVMVALLAGSVVAGPPVQQPDTAIKLAGTVASKISYQGRLTDASSNPLNGSYNLVFQLWDDPEAGSQVGGDVVRNSVPVSNGLFTVDLNVPHDAFNGQALWLRVQVNGQWLSPRQELLPVPYALSLRPGAQVVGDTVDPVTMVVNQGFGSAIKADSAGTGLDALGMTGVFARGYAVGVEASGMTGVRGQGDVGVRGEGLIGVSGYTESDQASGVVGTAAGLDGKGVEGTADFGTGVVGSGETGVTGSSAVGVGVRGEGSLGVEGFSEIGDGVLGTTEGDWDSAAVRGVAVGNGYGGYFTSTNSSGVIAYGYEGLHAEATSDVGYGVHGIGAQGAGVQGDSTFGYGVSGSGQLGGVFGTSTGLGAGVEGRVESGSAVLGVSTHGDGIVGNSVTGVGVYGNTGSGMAAVMGEGPKGVYGKSSADYGEGVHGHGLGSSTEGVLGTSDQAVGVWGVTGATWGLGTPQNLWVEGSCTGCTIAFVGKNGDASPLEVGDVVSISGLASPLKGQQAPVLQVRRATSTGGGALGVVQARASVTIREMTVSSGGSDQMDAVEMPEIAPGRVAPGDYLFVVVQGLVQVRADASSGAIEIGDAVGPAATAGLAQKLSSGTTMASALGRALEPLAKGTGLIWVLVLGR